MSPRPKQSSKKARNEELQDDIKQLWEGQDGIKEHVQWLRKEAAKQQSAAAPRSAEMSLDDVLSVLGNAPKKEKYSKPHGQVRKTMTNILKCVQTLGDQIAGGASLVFAPAPACFSALGFLIQFWVKHEDMFDKLDKLLGKCYSFLGRLHSYKNSMTLALQYVACKALHHVVKVCMYSVKIGLSKQILITRPKLQWEVWKALLKDGFLGESEIQGQMDEMEDLVQEEQRLLAAESFTRLTELTKSIADKEDQDEAERKIAADAKAWKTTISKSLWQEEDGYEPKPVWKNSLKNLSETLVQDTGEWIKGSRLFRAWSDADSVCSNPVLVLRGEVYSGKTCLVANIIKRFETDEARRVLAYFFYRKDSKQPLSTTKLRALISRSLLWQIATSQQSSVALTKAMARASAKMGYNPDDVDIWRQLLLDIDPKDRAGMKFYIIIDGLESDLRVLLPLVQAIAPKKATAEETLPIRILLTAKDSVIDEFAKKDSQITLRGDDESNLADITRFIEENLDSMEALKDTANPRVEQYRKKIQATLEEKTKGDYFWISTILKSLRNIDRPKYIDDVLDNIKKTRAKQLEDEIHMLDRELTVEGINEVNEIILWIIAARELPKLDEVNAVLLLSFGPGSLKPLQQRLAPLLEVNDAGRVDFKSRELKDIIREIPSNKTKGEMASLPADAQRQAETDMVGNFLEHVCPRKGYDKAKLEAFLWEKVSASTGPRPYIHHDRIDAHIRIAIICLKALTGDQSESAETLRTYAGESLVHHLQKVKLPQEDAKSSGPHASLALVQQIGTLLLDLFTKDESIDALFWTRAEHMSQQAWFNSEGDWLKQNRRVWLYTSEGVDELERWFNNHYVKESITEKTYKDMLEEFVTQSEKRHEILLKPAAKRLAHHLLFEDIFTTREECTAVYFLHGYVLRTATKTGGETSILDVDERAKLTMSDLLRIEDWAASESVFGPQAKETAMWQIRTAMAIHTMCQHDEKVDEERNRRISKARALDPDNLLASYVCAAQLQETTSTDSNSEAILKNAVDRIAEKDSAWSQTISRSIMAASIHLDLGDLYWAQGKGEDAADVYVQSIAYNSTRYSRYLGILRHYEEKSMWGEALILIGSLNDATKPALHARYLDRIIHEFLADALFQRVASKAAKGAEAWDIIESAFDQAIDMAQDAPVFLFYARKAYISILQLNSDRDAALEQIIVQCTSALESGRLQAQSGSGVSYRDIFAVVDTLALIYLNKAVAELNKVNSKLHTLTDIHKPSPSERSTSSSLKTLADLPSAGKAMPDVKTSLDAASSYALQIAALVQDADIWMNTGVNCCLAWYHSALGDVDEARKAVKQVMAAALGLLSDDDPSNDWFAFLHLARCLHALRDAENARTAWRTLSVLRPSADERLFVCNGCGEGIALVDGDRLCEECPGPIWLHEDWKDRLMKLYRLEKVEVKETPVQLDRAQLGRAQVEETVPAAWLTTSSNVQVRVKPQSGFRFRPVVRDQSRVAAFLLQSGEISIPSVINTGSKERRESDT